MSLTFLRQIFCIFLLYQLNLGFTLLLLPSSTDGTDFTHWSEDDWLETRFSIDTQLKFIFNHQLYENLLLRTRMNQWSLELSSGNRSDLNHYWTELNFFFDRHNHSTSLNNSIQGHVKNHCNPPVMASLTNNSNTRVEELIEMDQRIARYFLTDGFFRTINYVHCTIDDRRLNPLTFIQLDIYLVTNREFHSLLYIELSNDTRNLFADYQAKFYLHNHEAKFRYNFDIADIDYPLNSNTSLVHMIKLYNPSGDRKSNSTMKFESILIILLNLFALASIFLIRK